MQDGCALTGGPLQGARRGSPIQSSGAVMKTAIRIMRRADRNATPNTESSLAKTNPKRTTEMIVKSWIIESRERRRGALNFPQNAVRGKD